MKNSPSSLTLAAILLSTTSLARAQTALTPITLPTGTQLPVTIPAHLPMKAGTPIRAELLYPVYAGNQLVLPAKSIVTGTVVSLSPNHARRVSARLRGDFTPFHTPIVRFDAIIPPNGTPIPITTGTATDGAPIYRLVAPPPRKGGFLSRQFATLKQLAKDRSAIITGPDKGDRLTQLLYSQLPYHPERIVKATSWTVETTAPASFTPAPSSSASLNPQPLPPASPDAPSTWILQGYLADSMSSATSKPGQTISATVAEPVLNPDGSVAVPQGSTLTGSITSARPARRFARAGELRFSFRQLTLPGGEAQSVRASLRGADSSSAGDLAMNSEGEVKPKPQDKLVVPLLLLSLAARPLDRDGGRHRFRKDALASNSIGFLGFLLGTAARQPNLAAGIGYYGAAIAIYERIFARGKEVAFAKDTRVVIQTTATRSAALKPGQ